MIVHCLFEQSGTFKNEFKKLGFDAYDYDILNNFGETDYIVDLFENIRGGYNGEPSIFDNVRKEDLMIAFFPCVRFEDMAIMTLNGTDSAFITKKWPKLKILEYVLPFHKELADLYELVTMLAIIAYRRGLRLIIENPYSTQHYLYRYWPLKAKIIDSDRRINGDYFKKPTQYWFINIEPKQNLLFEPIQYVETAKINNMKNEIWGKWGAKTEKEARSMIHPQYANRFIRQYIL